MKLELEEGRKGDWYVEHFEITKEQAKDYNFGLMLSYQWHRSVRPGEYTRLRHEKRGIVMSTTPAEMRDLNVLDLRMRKIANSGNGRSFAHINGLGLGVATSKVLDCDRISKLTVVEIDPDVIELVGTQLLDKYGDRLEIINADALQYKPPKDTRYSVVWHDIWDEINFDNWEQYKFLHRRWGRHTDWQESWGRDELKRQQRESYRY